MSANRAKPNVASITPTVKNIKKTINLKDALRDLIIRRAPLIKVKSSSWIRAMLICWLSRIKPREIRTTLSQISVIS